MGTLTHSALPYFFLLSLFPSPPLWSDPFGYPGCFCTIAGAIRAASFRGRKPVLKLFIMTLVDSRQIGKTRWMVDDRSVPATGVAAPDGMEACSCVRPGKWQARILAEQDRALEGDYRPRGDGPMIQRRSDLMHIIAVFPSYIRVGTDTPLIWMIYQAGALAPRLCADVAPLCVLNASLFR